LNASVVAFGREQPIIYLDYSPITSKIVATFVQHAHLNAGGHTMGYAKFIDFANLSDTERKALTELLQKQKDELQEALRDANKALKELKKKPKKAKKSKKK
jgi:Spy/CpxP family protein refolding chaperone